MLQPPHLKTNHILTDVQRGEGGDSVMLEECLDAYTSEETLSEDDPWFCPKVRIHNAGMVAIRGEEMDCCSTH